MTDSDVLVKYQFHIQVSEEDVRDGDANPWERVVGAFASTIRELQTRVAELEPDATLGRLVREMPEGAALRHNTNGYDEWSAENVRGSATGSLHRSKHWGGWWPGVEIALSG